MAKLILLLTKNNFMSEISQLCTALQYTLSNEKEKRDFALKFLEKAEKVNGYSPMLMQIILASNNEIPDVIKLSASIQLKNIIKKQKPRSISDDSDEENIPNEGEITQKISPEEWQIVKTNIFKCMCNCPNKQVFAQLKACFMCVADFDYPGIWPHLLTEVKNSLISPKDKNSFYAGFVASQILTKVFRFQLNEKQIAIEPQINELYGILYEFAVKIVQNPSEESIIYLKFIGKSILNSIYLGVSEYLMKEGVIENWLKIFKTIFEWPVPAELNAPTDDPEDLALRAKMPIFKAKNISSLLFYRLFQKYGDLEHAEEKYKEFTKKVINEFSWGLAELFIKFIVESQSKFENPNTIVTAFRFLSNIIRNKHTNQKIKPIIPEILIKHAFPRLLLTKNAVKNWDDDPITFFKDLLDDNISELDPRYAAMVFIDAACSNKSYATYKNKKLVSNPILEGFLNFVGNAIIESMKISDARIFDAGLYVIGKLRPEIEQYSGLVSQIEILFNEYVLPNFNHPHGIIRTRCCYIIYEYASLKFHNKTTLVNICDALLLKMIDKELPVRLAAALAISKLCEKEEIYEKLKSKSLELISAYLTLISQVCIEEFVSGFENIIKTFNQEMKEYSIEIIKELVKTYSKISSLNSVQSTGDKAFDLTDSQMASAACIQTISRIIKILAEDSKNMGKLKESENIIIPILSHEIKRQELNVMESCIEIVINYTFYSPVLSKEMWDLFPLIYNTYYDFLNKDCGWGYELPKETIVVLQNYITKDPDTFLKSVFFNGKPYIEVILEFINKLLENSKKTKMELDSVYAIKLLLSLLEGLKVFFFC